ncbi:MAG: hypothetical protein ACRD2C_24805 [Acidimicrobiales bacterium]
MAPPGEMNTDATAPEALDRLAVEVIGSSSAATHGVAAAVARCSTACSARLVGTGARPSAFAWLPFGAPVEVQIEVRR